MESIIFTFMLAVAAGLTARVVYECATWVYRTLKQKRNAYKQRHSDGGREPSGDQLATQGPDPQAPAA